MEAVEASIRIFTFHCRYPVCDYPFDAYCSAFVFVHFYFPNRIFQKMDKEDSFSFIGYSRSLAFCSLRRLGNIDFNPNFRIFVVDSLTCAMLDGIANPCKSFRGNICRSAQGFERCVHIPWCDQMANNQTCGHQKIVAWNIRRCSIGLVQGDGGDYSSNDGLWQYPSDSKEFVRWLLSYPCFDWQQLWRDGFCATL